jgi:hypothetical protein
VAETRTVSSTGGEKGVKPQRYGLLPRRGLDAIAEVFAFGASKYADNNWRRGYEWDKSFDALLRHTFAAQDGETYDEESGLPHLAHAGFHILVLLTWLYEQGEGPDNLFDTRWPAGMERARRELEERKAAEQRDHEYFMRLDAIRKDLENGLEPYTDEECARQDGGMLPVSEDADRFTQNGFAVRRNPFYDESWLAEALPSPFVEMTLEAEDVPAEALDILVGTYTVPARFIVGFDGTTEDQEVVLVEQAWSTDYSDGGYIPSRWERG